MSKPGSRSIADRLKPTVHCDYYQRSECRSCGLLDVGYPDQVAGKVARAKAAIPGLTAWEEPIRSKQTGFRNKAKMVVGGTVANPTLGILDGEQHGVDLRECGLHTPGLAAALPALARFITTASLTPYSVPNRKGELKHVVVTESPTGDLMVRFVLRSTESIGRIKKHLPTLQGVLPSVRVVTANLLPEHKALLEGTEEIVLTEQQTLPILLGTETEPICLHLGPRSFFQTNTEVAATLYRLAAEWLGEVEPRSVWDLYCGVGGFALHLTAPGRSVIGVESSTEAITSARLSASEAKVAAEFIADDATAWAQRQALAPAVVILNPPRRGIGPDLADWLEHADVATVLYSSCNVDSLATDLAAMPSLRPSRGVVLDMFPHTDHFETLVSLHRV